ncbi:TPA: hypothetical protein RGL32_005562, partial [Klebsiella pneumoniae]|nr:hypothetical protein [Klebsiella pneumoniae]
AMLAEAEADAVEVIRNDPDLNEAAKNRRARDAANRDTLTAFTRSTAMISEQAENILNYLKTKLAPVAPLAEGDVVGFMRDSELRNVFRSLDGAAKEKLMVAMYAGNQTDLCDALLRGNAICSGVTDSQLERLTFARIATDNGAVIKSVSNLVKAINRNLQQIIAVRTWYANLVFGSNDDPRDVAPRVSGLANLSEYIDGMEKINYRQGKADDEDGKQAA